MRGPDGQGSAVVLHLMQEAGVLNKGYHLVTDNFYTKVKLAKDLWQKGLFSLFHPSISHTVSAVLLDLVLRPTQHILFHYESSLSCL